MEWRDEGVIVGVRKHGESSAIVELMTRDHGRHLGMVRGAWRSLGGFASDGGSDHRALVADVTLDPA